MNKISIILSSYNHRDYIKQSIQSVLNQSFQDFELIIWDDCSSDDSWEIINSIKDSRIRIFRNDKNYGGGNLNRAIKVARGDYIAIQHSDDVWEPLKLEKQLSFLENHVDYGAVFTHTRIINDLGQEIKTDHFIHHNIFNQPNRNRYEWLSHFFYKGNALCHPSVLIKKECYKECGSYRKGLAQIPDFDMWIRLCLKYEIHIIQEKLTLYRVHNDKQNSSSDRNDTRIRGRFEMLQALNNYKGIKSVHEFKLIFPEYSKYFDSDQFDIGFVLGLAALGERTYDIKQLFGLTLIFEALNEKERAAIIEEQYGFTHKDFINLTETYDIFSVTKKTNYSTKDLLKMLIKKVIKK